MSSSTPNGAPAVDDVPLFPADVIADPVTAHPADVKEPRKGGRPKGATTDPRKLAAARKLQGKPTPGPGRPSNAARTSAELTRQLAAGYELAGTLLIGLRNMAGRVPAPVAEQLGRFAVIGAAIRDNATDCAASIVAYSERSPRLRYLLEHAGQSASLLGIIVAHLPIALAVFGEPVPATVPPPVDTPAEYTPDGPAGFSPETLAEANRLADVMMANLFPGGVPGTPVEPVEQLDDTEPVPAVDVEAL